MEIQEFTKGELLRMRNPIQDRYDSVEDEYQEFKKFIRKNGDNFRHITGYAWELQLEYIGLELAELKRLLSKIDAYLFEMEKCSESKQKEEDSNDW